MARRVRFSSLGKGCWARKPLALAHTSLYLAAVILAVSAVGFAAPSNARGPYFRDHSDETRSRYSRELPPTIRGDHPAIQPILSAIRAISTDPLEQLVIVNDVTHLLVDYDEDARVYGSGEFHATLDEMIARRREAGWVYLRDDCDGRAVFAAHLLAGLNIAWELQTSYWKHHAWVKARVNGVDYDLIDLRPDAPELNRRSYRLLGRFVVAPTRQPPYFHWRRAWLERTNGDLQVGLRLGMLELDSTPDRLKERFSTDWTRLHPEGRVSPPDRRMLIAKAAGFPFGEALTPSAIARISPEADQEDTSRLSATGTTGSTGQ